MKWVLMFLLMFGGIALAQGQTQVKIKSKDRHIIKGEWMGLTDDQYMVRQDNGSVIYVPQDVVYKLILYKPYQDYPRYDDNRNTYFYGWSVDFNSTIGQENQNFKGAGINILMGYDWDHRYSVEASAGYRNMNIGQPETFLPVAISVKKYLTHGRHLLFTGMKAGYQWGIENKWNSDVSRSPWQITDSRITWFQPQHDRGRGPSLTPLLGVRRVGKYGRDQIFSIGLHFQKFKSHHKIDEDPHSTIELFYKRWQLSYGMVF